MPNDRRAEVGAVQEDRYWHIRRDIERAEGVVCLAIAFELSGPPAAFWWVLGILNIWGVWTWLARRRET